MSAPTTVSLTTQLATPTPTATSYTTEITPVSASSLFFGLIALASAAVAQPPLALLSSLRDSRPLRISPLFCVVDFLVTIAALFYALIKQKLTIKQSARAVLFFRSLAEEDDPSFNETFAEQEMGKTATLQGTRWLRLLALLGALSQFVKFCGMRGVMMELVAAAAYLVCMVVGELMPLLAADHRGEASNPWWRAHNMDPRSLRAARDMRRIRKAYRRYGMAVEAVLGLLQVGPLLFTPIIVIRPLALSSVAVLLLGLIILFLPAVVLISSYFGPWYLMEFILGPEENTPKSWRLVRSRRLFVVHTLAVAAVYYFALYTGEGTVREEWTEKLG